MGQTVGRMKATIRERDRRFTQRTKSLYRSMAARIERKKLGALPFTLEEFREALIGALGGETAALECLYCGVFIDIGTLSVDHKKPLARGGDTGLNNLNLCCEPCNAIKGELTDMEYIGLRQFLAGLKPEASSDVFSRLQVANKFIAGAQWARKKAKR